MATQMTAASVRFLRQEHEDYGLSHAADVGELHVLGWRSSYCSDVAAVIRALVEIRKALASLISV